MILWSIATNTYQKGETLRHQVKTLDEIGYIKSKDGGLKIQQDMLVVSVPLVELCDDGGQMKIMLIQVGKGVECLRRGKDIELGL